MTGESSEQQPVSTGVYRDTLWWNAAFSAYWFAASYKWFVILLILLPGQVAKIVRPSEKNGTWGLVFGFGAILAVFLPPIFGRINETWGGRWGYRQLWIAGGSLLTIAGCLVLSQASSMSSLILGYLMLQFGDQASTGPYAGMIPDTVPKDRLDFASGVLGALRLSAQIVSAVAAIALLAAGAGFGSVYLVIALVTLLCASATLWSIRGMKPLSRGDEPRGNVILDWIDPFRSLDFRYVWLNRFVVALAMSLVLTYAVNYLSDAFHLFVIFGHSLGLGRSGAETAALVLAISVAVFGTIGALLTPHYIRIYGRKHLLVAAGYTCCAMLIPCAFVRNFDLLLVLICVFAVGNGAYQAADWALVSAVLPNKNRSGTHMGVWHAADTVVQIAAGSIGIGIDLGNRFGSAVNLPWFGYIGSILTGSALFIASTWFVKHIKGSS